MKKLITQHRVVHFVFLTLLASSVFIAIRIALAPTVEPIDVPGVRVKSDYALMLLQCIFGVIAMLLPALISKKVKLSIPTNMFFAYAVFLYCAIYLGEVRLFYYRIPHWDTVLHTLSGAMLGALGYSVICVLNKSEKIPVSLSPAFVAVFTFCFAVSLGAVWEIYEFLIDRIFGTNMQKYALESGKILIGQDALADTMKDLIVDCAGALVMSVTGYVSLKYKKGWLYEFYLKKVNIENKKYKT